MTAGSLDLEASLMDIGCMIRGPAGTVEKAKELVRRSDYDAALLDANLGGRPVDEPATS